MEAPTIKMMRTDSLIPYVMNARTHSPEQVSQIAASIKEFGFTNPILVDGEKGLIAGHGRLMAAQKLELKEVPVIELTHLSEIQKKAYILADNKLALNAGWDIEMLKTEIEALDILDFDIDLLGFSKIELEDILGDEQEPDNTDPFYTNKLDAPIYHPSGDKPLLKEIYDDQKTTSLIDAILASTLDKPTRNFLIAAAARHTVFNYEKIANFYAHSSKECQEHMENSALVIIDYEKAIKNGFVKFTEEIKNLLDLQEGTDEENE